MASIATVADLEAWLGIDIPSGVQTTKAEAILAAASTLVRTKTGRAWVDADGEKLDDVSDDDFETVKTVVVQVAARVWTNPQGVTQRTAGPFSESVAEWAAFGLSLTETEIGMLPIDPATSRPALWTLATTRSDNDIPDIYLPVIPEGEKIPHVPAGSVNW